MTIEVFQPVVQEWLRTFEVEDSDADRKSRVKRPSLDSQFAATLTCPSLTNLMPTPFSRTLRDLEGDRAHSAVVIGLIAAGLFVAWALWFVTGTVTLYEVSNQARIEVARAAHFVDAQANGRVLASYLVLNKSVRAGDSLVELDVDVQRLQLEEAHARHDALVQEASSLETEILAEEAALVASQRTWEAALAEARSQALEKDAVARLAEDEANRLNRLGDRGLVPEIEVLRARSATEQRKAASETQRLVVARLGENGLAESKDRLVRLERLRSGLARARGQLTTSTSAVRRLDNEITRRRILSPIDGTLAEIAQLRAGAFVSAGQRLAAILPLGKLRVVGQFDPSTTLGRIRQGQQGRLRLAGLPWAQYGTLRTVVKDVAGEVRGGTVRVELEVETREQSVVRLQHGMPGSVEVAVERVSPLTLVLRTAGRIITQPARASQDGLKEP